MPKTRAGRERASESRQKLGCDARIARSGVPAGKDHVQRPGGLLQRRAVCAGMQRREQFGDAQESRRRDLPR